MVPFMKTRVLGLLGLMAALACPSLQAFDVPRHVYTFDRLAEAQADGFEDEKPLLLIFADPKKEPS